MIVFTIQVYWQTQRYSRYNVSWNYEIRMKIVFKSQPVFFSIFLFLLQLWNSSDGVLSQTAGPRQVQIFVPWWYIYSPKLYRYLHSKIRRSSADSVWVHRENPRIIRGFSQCTVLVHTYHLWYVGTYFKSVGSPLNFSKKCSLPSPLVFGCQKSSCLYPTHLSLAVEKIFAYPTHLSLVLKK